MRRDRVVVVVLVILSVGVLSFLNISTVDARPRDLPMAQPTVFPTPTPDEVGKILYKVLPGDTLWRIAAIAGLSVDELRALNGIGENDYIQEGMELVLGYVDDTVPPDQDSTPVVEEPTPTPLFGVGEVCVLLFLDGNGNAQLDDGELPLEGGQVSLIEASGTLAGEHTSGPEPEGYCFENIEGGDYNVSAAVPAEYNPTTAMTVPIQIRAGDIKHVEFGAQPSAANGGELDSQGSGQSALLGLAGAVLLIVSGGLGYYALRMSRSTPRSLRE